METKIKNLSNSFDDNLTRSANEVCDGIESVFDKKSVNMCGDLFDSGKVFYLNTNEELRMGRVVKPGSNTATVLGSGDFVIDSIYNGINDITCFDIISNPEYSLQDSNPFNRIRLVNDVCGYQLLEKRNYDVSLEETDSLSAVNGYRDKDTFVYVKKK